MASAIPNAKPLTAEQKRKEQVAALKYDLAQAVRAVKIHAKQVAHHTKHGTKAAAWRDKILAKLEAATPKK